MKNARPTRRPSLLLLVAAALFFWFENGAPVGAQTAFPKVAPAEGVAVSERGIALPTRSVFEEMLAAKSDNISITTDLDALVAAKKTSAYHNATIVFGKTRQFSLHIRPRGKFRRKVCEFPPLKLKFSKKELEAAGLSDLNEVKLVTHCADSEAGDQLLAREFLPYLMYAELTPISHRARLVDVTYIDSVDPKRKIKRLGILLEDDEELAARLGGAISDTLYNLPPDSLNTQIAATSALFEYMIGNTDWSLEAVRNIKLLRPTGGGKICPVPYDFDFSGFVNASYASPNSEFPIKTTRDRYWQGEKLPADVIRRASLTFFKKRARLHAIIDSASGIDELHKADLNGYIDSFFQILEETGGLPVNKSPLAKG